LPPGAQVSQAAHAAFEFAVAHADVVTDWHATSNVLVVLTTSDELSLGRLCADAAAAGFRLVRFHEPDLDGALTAAAFEPAAHRLVAHLPLAFARRREVRT
jgi:predicted deacylase